MVLLKELEEDFRGAGPYLEVAIRIGMNRGAR
jgi:hypothetical protein